MGEKMGQMERDKQEAIKQAHIIRQRYVKIVGAEKFSKDFPE
jgi:hypothetical protein